MKTRRRTIDCAWIVVVIASVLVGDREHHLSEASQLPLSSSSSSSSPQHQHQQPRKRRRHLESTTKAAFVSYHSTTRKRQFEFNAVNFIPTVSSAARTSSPCCWGLWSVSGRSYRLFPTSLSTTTRNTFETQPPIAERNESTVLRLDCGISIPDPYQWMTLKAGGDEQHDSRRRRLMDHVERENAYTESMTAHLHQLQTEISSELQEILVGREGGRKYDSIHRSNDTDEGDQTSLTSKDNEQSMPVGSLSNFYFQNDEFYGLNTNYEHHGRNEERDGGKTYIHFTRRLPTKSYAQHCRVLWEHNLVDHHRHHHEIKPENIEILLDENELAANPTTSTNPNISLQSFPSSYLSIHTAAVITFKTDDESDPLESKVRNDAGSNITSKTNMSQSSIPSSSTTLVAYSIDRVGVESYDIYVRNVRTGSEVHVASNTSGFMVWGGKGGRNKCLHFISPMTTAAPYNGSDGGNSDVTEDPSTKRPCQWNEWKLNPSILLQSPTEKGEDNCARCKDYLDSAPLSSNSQSVTVQKIEDDTAFSCSQIRRSSDDTMIFWTCENASTNQQRIWAKTCALNQDRHSRKVLNSTVELIFSIDDPPGQTRRVSDHSEMKDSGKAPSSLHRHQSPSQRASWADIDYADGIWWGITSTSELYVQTSTFVNNTISNVTPLSQLSGTSGWTLVDDWMKHTNLLQEDLSSFSLQSVRIFRKGRVVLQGRHRGLQRIWILHLSQKCESKQGSYSIPIPHVISAEEVKFDEPAHYVALCRGQWYSGETILVSYESLVEPPKILELNLVNPSCDRKVVWESSVPGYDPSLYVSDRFDVVARDHTRIPVSVCYSRQSVQTDASGKRLPCPVHLQGYGAYGHSLESAFSSTRLPLLRRGVISVTAHVRGGGELGRSWHENGKHLNKLNSINDFVDVAEWLIRNGWTTQDYLACEGRSAGALLVASAVNQRPDIFRASLLGVPFLDPINSMSDHSLPLTTTEYGEYGDPHQQVDLEYLMQYSPLHNMKVDRLYPSTLLVGGLLDSRVVFTDMVKYAAEFRLASSARNMQTAPLVCVKIDMASGHSFGSDINKYCAELGFMYAFLLDQILMECQQMD